MDELPDFAKVWSGYSPDAAWIVNCEAGKHPHKILIVQHKAYDREILEFTDIGGFIHIMLLDENGEPFAHNDGIWEYMWKVRSCGTDPIPDTFGRMFFKRFESSKIEKDKLEYLFDTINKMYVNWSDFPEVENYETVNKLHIAKENVMGMLVESVIKTLSGEVEKARTAISNIQKDIERMEGEITRIYEAGAAGLNLLEEYGHPFDVEGFEDMLKKKERERE